MEKARWTSKYSFASLQLCGLDLTTGSPWH